MVHNILNVISVTRDTSNGHWYYCNAASIKTRREFGQRSTLWPVGFALWSRFQGLKVFAPGTAPAPGTATGAHQYHRAHTRCKWCMQRSLVTGPTGCDAPSIKIKREFLHTLDACNGQRGSLVLLYRSINHRTEMILINQNGMQVSIQINMQSPDDRHHQDQCYEKNQFFSIPLKIQQVLN